MLIKVFDIPADVNTVVQKIKNRVFFNTPTLLTSGSFDSYFPVFKNITYISANVIFFNINRDVSNKNKLIFPNKITLGSNSLYLSSVILRNNTYILRKNDGTWWYNNDTRVEDFLKWRNGYIYKNCVSLIYFKKS